MLIYQQIQPHLFPQFYASSPSSLYNDLLIQDKLILELENRSDSGTQLLASFLEILNKIENSSSQSNDIIFKLNLINFLLSRNVHQEKLSTSERAQYIYAISAPNSTSSITRTSSTELLWSVYLP